MIYAYLHMYESLLFYIKQFTGSEDLLNIYKIVERVMLRSYVKN